MKNNFKEGDFYCEEWIPTYDIIKEYSKISGDYNPIHTDIEEAKKIGKDNIIVHGNLSCTIISKIIGMKFPGEGSLILEQNISFPNPIFPNDFIRFEFLIKSINYDLSTIYIKVKALKTIKHNEIKKTVLRGNILCLV